MADAARWTETDRTYALHWIRDRAKTRPVCLVPRMDLERELPGLRSIREPQNLAQALRLMLTEQAWQHLLLALRQRQDAPQFFGRSGCNRIRAARQSQVNGESASLPLSGSGWGLKLLPNPSSSGTTSAHHARKAP